MDDFGNPTDEGCVVANTEGTFSNSATTNSDLNVTILLDTKDIAFRRMEYGGNHSHITDKMEFRVKYGETEVFEFKTDPSQNGDRQYINQKDRKKIVEIPGEISFSAKTISRYGTPGTYRFTLDNSSELGCIS